MDPITAKEIATMLDNMPTKDSVNTLLDGVKGIDARLADLGKSLEPEPKADPDPEVVLERKGFFDDIMSFEFQGIPLGQAAVGGFVAIFASELVDGFMSNMQDWQRGLVKLAVAAAVGMWGKRLLGKTGSMAVALLLTFDALRDLSPIDSWADQLAEGITGRVTNKGLAGNPEATANQPANQKKQPASYYAMALGGGG